MVSDVTLALCGRQASGCVLMAKVVQTSRHAIRNYDQQEKYCSFEKKKKRLLLMRLAKMLLYHQLHQNFFIECNECPWNLFSYTVTRGYVGLKGYYTKSTCVERQQWPLTLLWHLNHSTSQWLWGSTTGFMCDKLQRKFKFTVDSETTFLMDWRYVGACWVFIHSKKR